MKFSELIRALPDGKIVGSDDPRITRIDYDSRRVADGSLFVAVRGAHVDGHRFIEHAFTRGAAAAIVETLPETVSGNLFGVVKDTRRALALLAGELTGHPDRELNLIGITGTNGKTTTVFLLASILENAYGSAGLIGTLGYRCGGHLRHQERTTPEAPDLYQRLTQMKAADCKAVAMEVSSHALVLQRVRGMKFAAAAFTNLTQDHLDFHRTMEAYFQAKAALFCDYDIGTAVLNVDDPYGEKLRELTSAPVLTYAQRRAADVQLKRLEMSLDGISFEAETPRGTVSLKSPLIGRFNVENLLCALAVVEALALPQEVYVEAAREFRGVPGRLERYDLRGGWAYVDYAHTPDALKLVLQTLRKVHSGVLYLLFGCGGDRDQEKRPLMGSVAENLADRVYLTTDNPRSEDPHVIVTDILAGIKRPERVVVELDRRQAIRKALDALPAGGVLLIAGKGHEDYQEIKGVKHHLDDREEVARYMQEQGK